MSISSHVTQAEYIDHHMQNWLFNLHTMSLGQGGFWTVNLDTVLMSLFLGAIFLGLFLYIARRAIVGVPGKMQNFIEVCVEWVDNTAKESCKGDTRLMAPLALTIFIWAFLMNFMDLVPVDLVPRVLGYAGAGHFRAVPTADPMQTFAMSITVFLLIIFYNLKSKGGWGLAKEMMSKPFGWYLLPVNVVFRLIEEIVKPVSLSLRLFGNLFAGEMVFILIAMMPWYAQYSLGLVWTLFHLLVIAIQAFIFMILTIVYLSMAQEAH